MDYDCGRQAAGLPGPLAAWPARPQGASLRGCSPGRRRPSTAESRARLAALGPAGPDNFKHNYVYYNYFVQHHYYKNYHYMTYC
eukprot:1391788-Heterocapsa_arctica.AAC.1